MTTDMNTSQADLNLALAVIVSSYAPLLLLDGDQTVIAASTSFSSAFDLDGSSVAGRNLAKIGNGEWAVPQLAALLDATTSGFADVDAYELDLKRPGRETRRVVVNAHRLDYADGGSVRLLVSLLDVTDERTAAKEKDDLLREKAILLREIQHRVANSLQIIASVLMQSARKLPMESRLHLHDAHRRVMSIADLQQHLAASRLGDVELRAYLMQLCKSLSASMIHDHQQITLTVEVDDSVTQADASVSLGLVVTELVINALKHAFPGHRKGTITVAYTSHGSAWTLRVSDDGIGIESGARAPKAGLGTSIVEALAKQLEATVFMDDAAPGTLVSLIHPMPIETFPERSDETLN